MKHLLVIVVFVLGELVIAWPCFEILKKAVKLPSPACTTDGTTPSPWEAIVRGMFERLTLLTGLCYGFPQILIAFGALKIGTRLSEEKECQISNTYFLIGNLMSILLAMVDAIVIRHLWQMISN